MSTNAPNPSPLKPCSEADLEALIPGNSTPELTPNTFNLPTEPTPNNDTPATEVTATALSDYHNAFEQEFTRSTTKAGKAHKNIEEIFVANGELVAQNVIALACQARSEMTRLNAAKYVIDYIKEINSGDFGDPIQNLLNRLQSDPATSSAIGLEDAPASIDKAFPN